MENNKKLHINREYINGIIDGLIQEFEQHTPFLNIIEDYKTEIILSKALSGTLPKADVIIHYSYPGLSKQFKTNFSVNENQTILQLHLMAQLAIEEISQTINKINQ